MVNRRIIVGVMGSGTQVHQALARPLGTLLADLGVHLLTGGGDGVMAEVSRAFCSVAGRRGSSIGVVRSACEATLNEHTHRRSFKPCPTNPWVEIPILTHLPLSGTQGMDLRSRNHINVLTADVLVALPGGAGTYSEVLLRIQYGRPLILLLGEETIFGKNARQIRAEAADADLLLVAQSVEEIRGKIQQSLDMEGKTGPH